MQLLTALAVTSDSVATRMLDAATVAHLLTLIRGTDAAVATAALIALSSLAFPDANKAALLAQPELLELLTELASTQPPADMHQLRVAAVRALATLGQNDAVDAAVGKQPLQGRGLRILALDGGGMKGLAEVAMLRAIEARTGLRVHELFDVIGGTSTGCMVAMGVGMMRFTLDEMDDVYLKLGSRVFAQGKAAKQAQGGDAATPTAAAAAAAAKDADVAAGSSATISKDGSVKDVAKGAAAAAPAKESWTESLAKMYRSGEQSMRVAMYGAKYSAELFEMLLRERTDLHTLGCATYMVLPCITVTTAAWWWLLSLGRLRKC